MVILGYLLIFVAKLIEVSLSTVRNVLIVRGEKLKGACIAFFEILLWIIVVSNVLQNLSEDPVKMIIYCLAYSLGNYCGVILEDKLAIGTACIQAVVGCDQAESLSDELREHGYGVTILSGEGRNGPVNVMMVFVKRKLLDDVVSLIRDRCPNAMITINDIRQIRNGFMKTK